jgi:thioredoxin 1
MMKQGSENLKTRSTSVILTLTDENFIESIMKSQLPVLVDFGAPWCGPCKMLSPLLEDIATLYADKLILGKINVDENQLIAERMKVQSIPMIVIFNKQKASVVSIGYQPKDQLVKIIDSILPRLESAEILEE